MQIYSPVLGRFVAAPSIVRASEIGSFRYKLTNSGVCTPDECTSDGDSQNLGGGRNLIYTLSILKHLTSNHKQHRDVTLSFFASDTLGKNTVLMMGDSDEFWRYTLGGGISYHV